MLVCSFFLKLISKMTDTFDMSSEPSPKRRKVRKGTHSCWECRRRKEKCTFGSSADVCIKCHRRGTKCVAQELPDEASDSLRQGLKTGDRVARVEALVDQLCKQRVDNARLPVHTMSGEENETLAHNIPTPHSSNFLSPSVHNSSGPSEEEPAGFGILQNNSRVPKTHQSWVSSCRFNELSQTLHKLLPSPEDTDRIIEYCGGISTLFFQMSATPYDELERDGSISPESLFNRPSPTAHPVLIARYMLYMANLLQHNHPTLHPMSNELSESPRKIMDRLTHSVSNLVISNDDIIACVEGLECMLIESWFQVNGGNLRKALITIRRALTIAQLMGYHRPTGHIKCRVVDPQTKAHPRFLWFRCVFLERHICNMLGLPQTTLDHSMASRENLENDIPMGCLERIHCVVASRILERHHSSQPFNDYSTTKDIDEDLKNAAAKLPCKWWLTPNLAMVKDQPDALFWEMRKLFHQLFHYNLLIQLHLPYMLSSSVGQNSNYSRVACANAAREVLSRFLAFRNFNKFASSCRTYDFFGLMAGLTLLIAHLDSYRRAAAIAASSPSQQVMTPEDLLAHQRPNDRALIEQIQENIEKASQLDGDALSTESSHLLKRLLKIEAEAADNNVSFMRDLPSGTLHELYGSDEHHVHLHVPYLGTVQVTHSGVISKLPTHSTNARGAENDAESTFESTVNASGKQAHGSGSPSGASRAEIATSDNLGGSSHVGSIESATNPYPYVENPTSPQFNSMNSYVAQGVQDPLFTAGADDWAFQGVDMAFFDNLMRWSDDGGMA
ncbi:unnamed protein product [Penicillium salamii]|uniref:Zn(2)-C6 fungal-type domain-containing protein n=1 Tax=Penicillium salamii TaxID=1612424 RepID=A0A9W4N508_9EURO|nr:unnamed protein product [Penicillium salamii]CAG8100296.1 unnamed protein product [Penicillium salamii]CAG8106083.1 unnamed protein product [Penicillium salamii]CAG8116510.1 unnamed protein product [Penicillium salamii]CAG8287500.1 unnamed protein product [Penicillium salamii]